MAYCRTRKKRLDLWPASSGRYMGIPGGPAARLLVAGPPGQSAGCGVLVRDCSGLRYRLWLLVQAFVTGCDAVRAGSLIPRAVLCERLVAR
jgi:hypothetical protein